jgi:hypothetical protein
MLARIALLGAAAALFALPAFADDTSSDNTRATPDRAWYGDNDYSRCPSHRPLDVFRDGEGGFQAWRVPRRVCGWGTEPQSQQRYGGSPGHPHG